MWAAVQQAVVLVFAALILDGGLTLRFCVAAAILSWICVLVVMIRHPKEPTWLDLGIVKYGFWFAVALILVAGWLLVSWGRILL